MNHLAGDDVLVGSDISIFVITRLFHPLVSGVLDWCLVSPCTYIPVTSSAAFWIKSWSSTVTNLTHLDLCGSAPSETDMQAI